MDSPELIGVGRSRIRTPSVRAGISSLAQLAVEVAVWCVQRLGQDLASGKWDARYGYLRELTELDLGYRLLIAQLAREPKQTHEAFAMDRFPLAGTNKVFRW